MRKPYYDVYMCVCVLQKRIKFLRLVWIEQLVAIYAGCIGC